MDENYILSMKISNLKFKCRESKGKKNQSRFFSDKTRHFVILNHIVI